MNMHKASKLRDFLESLGVDARKGLSQNFLIDGNILRKIASAANVQPGDLILEIGPGPGALTELLLELGARVTAVELDPIFAQALTRLQTEDQRLHVIQADFLSLDLAEILKTQPWKVVANLPYHITTPILAKLLPHYPTINSITIMVQKEVADRMVAAAHTANYSSLSLFVSFYSQAKLCFKVEPTCFYPRPKIQSAVVHCSLRPIPEIQSVEAFFIVTRTAFQHRRKMLRSSLKEIYPPKHIEHTLVKMNLPLTARPEELSLDQFLELTRLLNGYTPSGSKAP